VNEHLSLSQEGANLVKAFESCLKRDPARPGYFMPYYCPAGVLTIGWGHTNHHGRTFDTSTRWTQAECDAEFVSDMRGFERAVKKRVKVPLTQYQFDALVSFAYNCGEGNLAKSTLLRKVNAGDHAGAARQFAAWNKGGGRVLSGLVRRRASEALLYQGIPDRNYDGRPDRGAKPLFSREPALEEMMPQQVDPPVQRSMAGSKTGAAAITVAGSAGVAVTDKVSEHLDKVAQVQAQVEQGFSVLEWVKSLATDPFVLVGVVVVAAAVFIWFDRRKRLQEEV